MISGARPAAVEQPEVRTVWRWIRKVRYLDHIDSITIYNIYIYN